jgi:hypothetical protein
MKDTADAVGRFPIDAFHLLATFAIGATTVWKAVREANMKVDLAAPLHVFSPRHLIGDGLRLFADGASGRLAGSASRAAGVHLVPAV